MCARALRAVACLALLLFHVAQARGVVGQRPRDAAAAALAPDLSAALSLAATAAAAATADAAQAAAAAAAGEHGPAAAAAAATQSGPRHSPRQCPQVGMSSRLVSLRPGYSSFWGQRGAWQASSDDLIMGYWSQTFFAQDWGLVAFQDQDGRMAARVQETTQDDLLTNFRWKAGAPPKSFSSLASLQQQWESAMYRTALRVQTSAEDPSQARVLQLKGPATTSRLYALTDCTGELLYVVSLQDSTVQFPGAMDIYNSTGGLVAHTLTHSRVARHLFVDTQGYLLATAEAPRINDSIPYRAMPKDSARGGVLAYQLKIEQGGYENSSLLLDQDNLWVLAAVTQLRAIRDGRAEFSPVLPKVLPWAYWLVALALALLVLVAAVVFKRLPVLPTVKYLEQEALMRQAALQTPRQLESGRGVPP